MPRRFAGSVACAPPNDEVLHSLHIELSTAHRDMGVAELQLYVVLGDVWVNSPDPDVRVDLNYARYGEIRGIKVSHLHADNRQQRRKFNLSVMRLASLDVDAKSVREVKARGKSRPERQPVRGRLVIAEPIGFVGGGQASALCCNPGDVTGWHLRPGPAWHASRGLHQLGRYPVALIQLDPHKYEFHVRLGVYLGYQSAVRAGAGTFAQPLSVRAILAGMRQPIPQDAGTRFRIRQRLEAALGELQRRGILWNWQWGRELSRDWLNDSIQFLYHRESLEAHALHHPRARKALESPEVRGLQP